MIINRSFLIYIIGLMLSITYNSSIASPYDGVFNNRHSVSAVKTDHSKQHPENSNPWARKMPMKRSNNQKSSPVFSENTAPRFITEQELDALNNPFYSANEAVYSYGWKPLPMLDGMGQSSRFEVQPYNQIYNRPYNDGFYNNSPGYGLSNPQWGNNSGGYPAASYPLDPMNPGGFGIPFGGPFNGIDSFMYE